MDNPVTLDSVFQDFIHHVHMVIQSEDAAQLVEYRDSTTGESVICQREVGGMRYTLVCEPEGDPNLSTRQSQILDLMCRGMTTKQIAYHLQIKPTTVDTYIRRIFEKLGVNSRVEVVALAFRKKRPRYSTPVPL